GLRSHAERAPLLRVVGRRDHGRRLNASAQQLLGVAKGYLGPATQTFLSSEFQALGFNANTIGPAQLEALVTRVRTKAARAMGDERAAELASARSACCSRPWRSRRRISRRIDVSRQRSRTRATFRARSASTRGS